MRNKAILTLSLALLLLSGCDISKRVQRVQQKALNKGITIPKDTITITNSDTITTILTLNDTTYVTKVVTKTVTLEPIVEYKTKWQTKIEYKERIKYLKGDVIIQKEKTKQVKAENRTRWLMWLIIGLVVGLIIPILLKKIRL